MKVVAATMMAFFLVFSMSAFSGYGSSLPVTVDFDNRVAAGDMYSTRSEEGANWMIGCGSIVDETTGASYIYCQAGDNDAQNPNDPESPWVGCTSTNPDMIRMVGSLSSYSYISFEWYDDDPYGDPWWHTCSKIQTSTQSQYVPLIPVEKEKEGK